MELSVNLRTQKAKELKKLRKENIVPGIIYGKYIDAPVTVSCDKQSFLKAYKNAGYSMPITLKGDGVDQLVLIHDIQVDPVTDYVLHVDFITLKKGQKVQTEVQIIIEGEALVEKLGLGNVQLVKDSIEIEAFPKDLPHNIVVDISKLETTNDVIFVKDLDLGTGVELIGDPDQAVVTVLGIVEEEVEEEVQTEEETITEGGEEKPNDSEDTKESNEEKSE